MQTVNGLWALTRPPTDDHNSGDLSPDGDPSVLIGTR